MSIAAPLYMSGNVIVVLGELGRHRHIAVSQLLNQIRVCIVQHNMEVLNRMYALQAPPVFEPRIVLGLDSVSECFLHERVNLLMRFRCRESRLCIFVELELSPHNQMHNPIVDAVGPVVVQDLQVLFKTLA